MAKLAGKELGTALLNAVRGYVARSIAPLVASIKQLDAQLKDFKPEKGDKGDRGDQGLQGPAGPQGRDALELGVLPAIDEKRSYPRGTYARHLNGLWRAFEDTLGMRGWECVVAGVATLTIESPSERELVVRAMLSTGDEVLQKIKFTHPVDKGVYRPEQKYSKGDGVTFGGSWWIAQVDEPTEKPGIPAPGTPAGATGEWRLAVKKGRDGKDAAK